MAAFNNYDQISNQAGNQTIHGSVHFNTYTGAQNTEDLEGTLSRKDNNILGSLAFPTMLDRRGNVERPHMNSCRWILETDEYTKWKADSNGLLWIKGKPGTGKSTMMAFLYKILREQHEPQVDGPLLEFFFSARGSTLQHTPIGMLRSLTNQLFGQSHDIRPRFRQLYDEKCRAFGSGERAWEWQKAELESLFLDSMVQCAERQSLTIFVDALDEAGNLAAQETAEYFHRLNDYCRDLSGGVKICISCRHYPILPEISAFAIRMEEHNGHDIHNFVMNEIRLEKLIESTAKDIDEWKKLQASLSQQAAGVFQWIRLVVPLIRSSMRHGDSVQEVRGWLKQVPQELRDIYAHIISNVIEQRYRPQALQLFQWVCLAGRPLTVTELRFALAAKDATSLPHRVRCYETSDFIDTDERMRLRIKSWSGGLIEVALTEYQTEIVQVVHQSVNDFLCDTGLAFTMSLLGEADAGKNELTSTVGYNAVERSHAALFRSCVNFLTTEDTGSYETPVAYMSNFQKADTRVCREFLEYAARGLFHAKKSRGYWMGAVEEQVQFLQPLVADKQKFPGWALGQNLKLEAGFEDIPECPQNWSTVVHAAARANLTNLVRHLVDSGVDVASTGGAEATPLHLAAMYGNQETVEILYQAGADLLVRDIDGRDTLWYAVQYGHIALAEWLLRNMFGGDLAADKLVLPMTVATRFAQISLMKIMIAAGADVNSVSEDGWSLLNEAVDVNCKDSVRFLLDSGADPNNPRCKHDVVEQILHSSYYGEDMVEMLLDGGARIRPPGDDEVGLLLRVVRTGNKGFARVLVRKGADVNAHCGLWFSTLRTAIRGDGCYGSSSPLDMIKLLVDHGARWASHFPDRADSRSPLHFAAERGDLDVIQYLIDQGFDVDATDLLRRTPLHVALYYGHEECAAYLLRKGADLALRNEFGQCAFDLISHESRLFELVGEHLHRLKYTPANIRARAVRASVRQISRHLLEFDKLGAWPGFIELAHCLAHVGDYSNAITTIQAICATDASYKDEPKLCRCFRCGSRRPIHILCSQCPYRLFCQNCKNHLMEHDIAEDCQTHVVLDIGQKKIGSWPAGRFYYELQAYNNAASNVMGMRRLLRELVVQYSDDELESDASDNRESTIAPVGVKKRRLR